MADIKRIAEELVRLSDAQTYALACFLAKEYGISAKEDISLRQDIPSETEKTFTLKDGLDEALREVALVREAQRRAEKRQWFVPKTIGKPCKVLLKKRK